MSLILQEEQDLHMIQQSEIINSVYLNNYKFVFGERFIDDSTFFTEIELLYGTSSIEKCGIYN